METFEILKAAGQFIVFAGGLVWATSAKAARIDAVEKSNNLLADELKEMRTQLTDIGREVSEIKGYLSKGSDHNRR